MTRVAVNPKLLEWALRRSQKDADELSQRFPKYSLWLRGEAAPTLNQLEQFSKATSTPLGFLFLPEPPTEHLPIPHYRTAKNKEVSAPSAELIDTIYAMQRRQAWLREFLQEEGRDRVPLVRCAKISEDAVTVS